MFHIIKKIIFLPLFIINLIINIFNIKIIYNKYNNNIGPENIYKEYKLFTFINNIPIDYEEAKYYCSTYILLPNFNTHVLKNIYIYIKVFLQKNIYAFINSKINGDFYIGVDDDGFMKGIPYDGIFPKYIIYIYIQFILYFYSNNCDVYKYISITFINLTVNNNDIIYIKNDSFIKFLEDEKNYYNILNNYKKKFNDWLNNYHLISRKLSELANDPKYRIKIIEFIINNSTFNSSKLLKIFYSSYKFKDITASEINNYKINKYHPYYWITKWKDYECNNLLFNKPIKPILLNTFDKNLPFRLINCLKLGLFWKKKNPNINFTVIHINIKSLSTNKIYLYESKIPYRKITCLGIPFVKLK